MASFPAYCGYRVVEDMTPAIAVLPIWQSVLFLAWGIVLASLIGLLIGGILGGVFLGPLHHIISAYNGGPFEEGDTVLLLLGPRRGHTAEVYSRGQFNSVFVDLGLGRKMNSKEEFANCRVLRQYPKRLRA